MKVIPETLCVH